MMKKKYLMNGMALLALGLTMGSCSKETGFTQQDAVSHAEKELGVTINSNTDWKMTQDTRINVSVNLDYGATYTVFISTGEPLIADGTYIGRVEVKSGVTEEIIVSRPTGAAVLYAACYDKDNHAICKSFPVKENGASVSFGESTSTTKGIRRAVSTGNRWSVTPQNMPDLSTYMTGDLIEMQESINTNGAGLPINQADGREAHLKITGSYSGSIARLQSYANQSVYVTGTWTVPQDQRVTGNSAVVVGNGGKIVVPSGHMLSTNANNNEGTTGMIYVLPGGIIEGEGQLQFSNGTQTYSYNAGTITVSNININGGTLYNAGTIGNGMSTTTALEGPGGTPDQPSKFINLGHAYFSSVSGAGMAIENACNMYVTGDLALGNSSKMDNGSYIQCGTLHLNGSNNGDIVLYMGNAAYMNCLGDVSVNNFGVWGPNGNNGGTINRAIFKINGCSYCNLTKGGNASYYMVDNVELIIPNPFFDDGVKNFYTGGVAGQLNTQHADYYKAYLFYGWFNGQGFKGIDSDNYEWVQIQEEGYGDMSTGTWRWVVTKPGFQGYVLKDNASFYDVDESRATCIYGTSPSYNVTVDESDNCGVNIIKEPDPIPDAQIYSYAFEDSYNADYDMNDVVVKVQENSDDASKLDFYLMCTGASYDLYVYLTVNGMTYPLFNGAEVHAAMGGTAHMFINTGTPDGKKFDNSQAPAYFSMTKPAGVGNNLATLDVWIKSPQGDIHVATPGQDPHGVVIPSDWDWPKEYQSIKLAYPDFVGFADPSTRSSYLEWYKNPNTSLIYQ